MIWLALPALALATSTGAVVMATLSPLRGSWHERLLFLALATFIGLSLHSLWHFLWLVTTGGARSRIAYLLFDVSLPVLLMVATGVRGLWRERKIVRVRAGSHWMWPALGLVVLAAGLWLAALSAGVQPDGGWDAWAVWNLKARWIALGGEAWTSFIANAAFINGQPDYPLLLPLSIARLWQWTGGSPLIVQQGFAVSAAVLLFTLVYAGIWRSKGPMTATVGVAALMGVPSLPLVAGSQYADVPLACSYVAALLALSAGMRVEGSVRWFAVAGLSSGAAMWIKNEGLLFTACALTATLAVTALTRTRRTIAIARVGHFSAGVAPFLLAVLVLKASTPANVIVTGQSVSLLADRLLDGARHLAILDYTARVLHTMLSPAMLALFAVYIALRGRITEFGPTGTAALTVLFTALGYYAVFLFTPHPLDWHLRTAADRLVIQIWPSVVFTAALVCGREMTEPAPAGGGEPVRA